MLRSEFGVHRPVSAPDSLDLMFLQAKISRVVGTHVGSGLSLYPTSNLGTHVLPPHVVRKAAGVHPGPQFKSQDHLRAYLLDEMPASGKFPLRAVVAGPEFRKRSDNLRMVSLALASLALNREQDSFYRTLEEISLAEMPRRYTHRVDLAVVDEECIPEVTSLLEQEMPSSIALLPAVAGNPHGRLRVPIPREEYAMSMAQPVGISS